MAKKRKKRAAKKRKSKKVAAASRKLSPRALGLSLGIIWGLAILLVGLAAHYWQYGLQFVSLFEALYPGFTHLTIQGSIIGALWGLVDGFVFGVLIGWLYNRFA